MLSVKFCHKLGTSICVEFNGFCIIVYIISLMKEDC